jgi:hypothetical protein
MAKDIATAIPLVRQIGKYKTIPEAARGLSREGISLEETLTTIMFLAGQLTAIEAKLEALQRSKSYARLDDTREREFDAAGKATGRHDCSGRVPDSSIKWPSPVDWTNAGTRSHEPMRF